MFVIAVYSCCKSAHGIVEMFDARTHIAFNDANAPLGLDRQYLVVFTGKQANDGFLFFRANWHIWGS